MKQEKNKKTVNKDLTAKAVKTPAKNQPKMKKIVEPKSKVETKSKVATKAKVETKPVTSKAKVESKAPEKKVVIKEAPKGQGIIRDGDKKTNALLKTKIRYTNSREYCLRLKNVKKTYGHSKKVLKGVTLDIKKGERVSIIGKNGSGKSTLISIISQQVKMNEGSINYGYASNKIQSLELMGIQFQKLVYPEGFIVKDVIHFFNVSVDKAIRMSKRELNDIISLFGIDKYLDQKIDRLSGGQQQRINILLALIKKPKILILDEISTGLDVKSAEIIKDYINKYLDVNKDVSLLLVSHSAEEISELTDRAYVLESGKIVEELESKKLTEKMFLEITSREPKLTKKEKAKIEEDSEKALKSFNRTLDFRGGFNNSLMEEGNSIEINDVNKTYGKKVGAVRDFSLNIKDGERVSITGPNGSGKSTIVEIIAQVKDADKKSKFFKNKKNLIIADAEHSIRKLEEKVNIELRKIRNDYRYKRQDSENDIADVKAKLSKDIKKAKAANKTEADITALREASKRKIDRLIKATDRYVDEQKAAYDVLEVKLKAKLEKEKLVVNEIKENELKDLATRKEEKKKAPKLKRKDIKPEISYSFASSNREVKDTTGVQFQYASFPSEMSVKDVILFFSRTNKETLSKAEIVDAIKVFKLEKLLNDKAYKLSGGERQRLNVLLSIMKNPKLLILDEISTGLDVDSIVKIDKFIKEYLDKSNATLIVISHNYHEVHSLTDKIVVMKYGKLEEVVDKTGWTIAKTKAKMRDIYAGGGF